MILLIKFITLFGVKYKCTNTNIAQTAAAGQNYVKTH